METSTGFFVCGKLLFFGAGLVEKGDGEHYRQRDCRNNIEIHFTHNFILYFVSPLHI